MKTRLSEKAKSRLQKEQTRVGILKRKTCIYNSETKEEKRLCQKKETFKEIKKSSLSLCSKIKINSHKNDNTSMDTGKKLMMLRCLNREEAMEGKDFIFTVHYVDSADNFAFDYVLMQKQIVNNEKYQFDNEKHLEKKGGLNDADSSVNVISTEKVEISSKTSDSTIQNDCLQTSTLGKGINSEVCKKSDEETKMPSNQLIPTNSEKSTMGCTNDCEDLEANEFLFNNAITTIHTKQKIMETVKSPSVVEFEHAEKNDRDTTMEEHSCLPIQKIQITTDDIAKHKREFCFTTQKSLKRNLKEEFADALRQSKGEKKIIVEVGCNAKLSEIAESTQSRKALPLTKNSDSDVPSDQKSHCLNNTEALVNEKGTTVEILNSTKIPHSAEMLKDKELTAQKPDDSTLNCKQMQNINDIVCTNNHTAHDRNGNLSSINSTVSANPLKESFDIDDQSDELCCNVPFLPDNEQVVERMHLSANTLVKATDTLDVMNCDKNVFINKRKKSKTITESESDLTPSVAESFQTENVQNSEIVSDCSVQKILQSSKTKSTSILSPEKHSMKCKGNKQSDINSGSLSRGTAKSRVKVNNETSTQTVNTRNYSSHRSLQKSVSEKNVVTVKENAPVVSQKKRSIKGNTEENNMLQPRITRSLLKKLCGLKN